MRIAVRGFLPILVSLVLSACSLPKMRSLTQESPVPLQPVDVVVVVRQPKLYGAFNTMKITQSSTNPCVTGIEPGSMPDVSWTCGGLTDMVAAKFTAARARKAEETVRPVRKELGDLDIAEMLDTSIAQSLKALPNLKVNAWTLAKANPGAVEEAYRASTANAVLFIHLDYRLSTDFSAFEVTTNSLLYARSLAARTAAGFNNATLPGGADSLPALLPSNAIYRSAVIYHAELAPQPDNSLAANATIWTANGARLVRAALEDARIQLPRLMAEEFQRGKDVKRTALRKVEEQEITMDLIAEQAGRQWLAMPDGTLYYKTGVPGAPPAPARTAAE